MHYSKEPYLTFQSNSPYVLEHMKDYSPTATYSITNVNGIHTNLMNMTIPSEIVVSFANFQRSGLATVMVNTENPYELRSQKHEGFEVYFVMNGTLSVQLEKTIYQLKHYDAILMNQNCKSLIFGGENLILITITISVEYLQKHKLLKTLHALSYKSRYDQNFKDAEYIVLRAKELPNRISKPSEDGLLAVESKEDVERLVHQFHTELSKKRIGYEPIVSGLLMRLFYSITNKELYDLERVFEHRLSGEDIAENIKSYLDETPKKITMNELTDIFHYNRNYLSKVFMQMTNQSIKSYNNMICMQEAKRLLTETSLPISFIAEQLGFLSRSQFYKVFEAHFYCTPQSLRED